MHTIYFTRHGQTTWNVENKICGVTDAPLTEKVWPRQRLWGWPSRPEATPSTRSWPRP